MIVSGGAVLCAALLAWLWLFRSANVPEMGAMDVPMEPWSPDYLVPAFLMWVLMMMAMMLPSAMPMFLLHARIRRAPDRWTGLVHSAVFVAAYLLVWSLFSLGAATAQSALVDAGAISEMGLRLGHDWAAAGLLLAASAYQFSSAKRACLQQCQSPLIFIMRHWKPGAAGAGRLGLAHGAYCLGCCWLLMALLFVGGVMSLTWIALLAAVVFLEKVAPRSWKASSWIGTALAGGAAFVLLA